MLVAPDAFKGTFTAAAVAAAVAAGARAAGVDAVELPLADGGEGTMDALLAAFGGERRSAVVTDPFGRPLKAEFALLADGATAVVETAQASGLSTVADYERDAWVASTGGTGELIVAAAKTGATRVLVAVGGSATTDGGRGAIDVLDAAGIQVDIDALCDVETTWEDCARIFGPQKGGDPRTIARLERRLEILAGEAPRDPRGVPRTGCAGGLSGALWAWCGARLLPGAATVMDAVGFDEQLATADLVITGEGRLDEQTAAGKVAAEVGRRCAEAGVSCHAFVGRNALDGRLHGITHVAETRTVDEFTAAAAHSLKLLDLVSTDE